MIGIIQCKDVYDTADCLTKDNPMAPVVFVDWTENRIFVQVRGEEE